MKLGIIDSAFQQAGVDTRSGLEHIARIGFDCVDIFTEALSISEEDTILWVKNLETMEVLVFLQVRHSLKN